MFALLTVLAIALGSGCLANNGSSNGMDGFGYELLLGRIEFLENTMKESQERVRRELRELQTENKKLVDMVLHELREFKNILSCRKNPTKESGVYKLKEMNTAFDVYCEQNLYGGGWIVIQNRFDGSVDFDRKWNDYRNGFGSLDGEFWIGLEKIYLLTTSKKYELMVHMEDHNGVVKYANYEKFRINDENDQYRLSIGAYNGTAGNSLSPHGSDRFSTRDRDNDRYGPSNLAIDYLAGWWHGNSGYSERANLNGYYIRTEGDQAMYWSTFNGNRKGLKVSKMMIREM